LLFFFDSLRLDDDAVDFYTLYIVKTEKFNKRLYNHWQSDNKFINEYWDGVAFDDGKFDIDNGIFDILKSSIDIKIAVWFESDEREQMFLEHELIYKLRPILNKE
jgi:hypothetical protein